MQREWAYAFRRARIAAKITTVELGRQLGFGPVRVSTWEAGTALPKPAEWRKISTAVPDLPALPNLKRPVLPMRVKAQAQDVRPREPKPPVGPYAEFASRLRAARTAANLTRLQLAKAVKASASSIANWETGGHLPQNEPLQRLRAALSAQWGTPEERTSLAAWEVTAPKASGRFLRRRGPASATGILRAKTSMVQGAHGFLTRFVAAVAERRITSTQIAVLLSMLRQFDRREASVLEAAENKVEATESPAKKAPAKKAVKAPAEKAPAKKVAKAPAKKAPATRAAAKRK